MTRLIVFTSAFAIAASAAMAGDSVLFFKSAPTNGSSVLTFNCDDCPAIKPSFVAPDVHGVEVQEHDVDGEKKIVQMDNMMGGSNRIARLPGERATAAHHIPGRNPNARRPYNRRPDNAAATPAPANG